MKIIRGLTLLTSLTATLSGCGQQTPQPQQDVTTKAPERSIAAGGVTEPRGEEHVIIPEIAGRLKAVYVEEGDEVAEGQLLAEMAQEEYAAQVSAARANVDLRAAELAKLKAGARLEEILQARVAWEEAALNTTQKDQEYRRREALAKTNTIGKEMLDQARLARTGALKQEQAAKARLDVLEKGARAEDLAMAQAALNNAKAALELAKAQFAKTRIRAPIAGTILKKSLKAGETIVALSPTPLLTLGDLSRLRVRADIDEYDVGRIEIGRSATITADAFPARAFKGQVVQIGQRMGRRNIQSDRPAEKVDVKILEAVIELEQSARLPIGLRVDVRIDAEDHNSSAGGANGRSSRSPSL